MRSLIFLIFTFMLVTPTFGAETVSTSNTEPQVSTQHKKEDIVFKGSRGSLNVTALFDYFDKLNPCTSKLWPGYEFSKFSVFDPQTKVMYSWPDRQKRVLSAQELKQLPKGFDSRKVEGGHETVFNVHSLYRGPQSDPVDVAQFMVHEDFHLNEQEAHHNGKGRWKIEGEHHEEAGRGQKVPASYLPRYQRAMLARELRAALTTKGKDRDAHIKNAAGWYSKFKETAGVQALKSCDLTEGTASYIDNLAGQIMKNGCQSRKELARLAGREIDRNIGASAKRPKKIEIPYDPDMPKERCFEPGPNVPMHIDGLPVGGSDTECYRLGDLAGSLLDQQNSRTWRNQAELFGKPPVEILLSKYKPTALKDNMTLKSEFQSAYRKWNGANESQLGELVDQFKSPAYIRLSIPITGHQMVSGYGGPVGFFRLDGLKNHTVVAGNIPGLPPNSKLNVKYVKGLMGPHPCKQLGKEVITLLIPKNKIKSSGSGEIEISSMVETKQCKKQTGVWGTLNVEKSSEDRWYCGKP